eukprot:TRINITY_DN3580_c0_g6_i1.p1 TRINITY_DN3580_c0_g6~~TRINITY_DN3580_c0_g6_i1.p1  ORF type:complete len:416 (-),score=61.25 TRINITY_DN3580_c0_g6_i1:121-1368(-)
MFVSVKSSSGQERQVCFDFERFQHEKGKEGFPSGKIAQGTGVELSVESGIHNGKTRLYVISWHQRQVQVSVPVEAVRHRHRAADVTWVRCPVCPPSSLKRFEATKGLLSHLGSIHPDGQHTDRSWAEWTEEICQTARSDGQFAQRGFSGARRNNPNVGGDCAGQLSGHLQAAAVGDIGKLREAVKHDSFRPLDCRDGHGATALDWAAGAGHLDCLKFCVESAQLQEHGAIPMHRLVRRDGRTALHWAARNGRTECVRWLMSEESGLGLNVDSLTADGTTPLMLCCFGGTPECCRTLICELGANPLRENHWGCNCSHWAAMSEVGEMVSVEMCRLLHDEVGVGFGKPQSEGHTPLDKAVLRGNSGVVRWLLSPEGMSPEERLSALHVSNTRLKSTSNLAQDVGELDIEAQLKEHGF